MRLTNDKLGGLNASLKATLAIVSCLAVLQAGGTVSFSTGIPDDKIAIGSRSALRLAHL